MPDMKEKRSVHFEEKVAWSLNGFAMLGLVLLLGVGIIALTGFEIAVGGFPVGPFVVLILLAIVGTFLLIGGFRIIRPNEALVLTLFGKYYGTLKGEGFYWVNPFVSGVNPASGTSLEVEEDKKTQVSLGLDKRMSLKAMTLSNQNQKINDLNGNPIIIGIVVIWRITNTAKAAFNVDHYVEYLSTQTDSALRNTVRLYPYDGFDADVEKSLIGSTQEVAARIKAEIQEKVDIAGLEVMEARITHLAYAPEIASAMLQRQQARAIIDARAMIVDGAVGMVQMALGQLEESQVVELDEERKASMVSNLLVVLCGNQDATPIINSGSLY